MKESDSNLQKELELIKALIDKLFKHSNEQFDTQIKINRAVYYRLGKLEDAKLEPKPELSAPVKGWLPTGKEAAIAVNVCLWIVVLSCLIAQYVKAETPNWFLYDQRIGQKAQEYKNRWSSGNDGDKLAATYYDAALGFEYISRRLGDPSLTNTALAAAQYYSSNYVVPAGGVVPGNWIFTDGLRKFGFGSTVNLLAQNGSYCMTNVAHEPLYNVGLSREVAYCLKAMLNAQAMGYTVNQDRLFQHISAAQSHLEQWASGVGIPYLRPFMVGLTANSVIRYHDTIAPLGIRERLQAVATKMKNELWIESARAFKYTDRVTPEGGEEPAPDLNLLIAPMYAWLGDREFAGKIFNGGVEGAYLGNIGNMKQFNQNVAFVPEFEQWIAAVATPSPTPTVVPTPTPCVRPANMNSVKKLDQYINCRVDRIVTINELRE